MHCHPERALARRTYAVGSATEADGGAMARNATSRCRSSQRAAVSAGQRPLFAFLPVQDQHNSCLRDQRIRHFFGSLPMLSSQINCLAGRRQIAILGHPLIVQPANQCPPTMRAETHCPLLQNEAVRFCSDRMGNDRKHLVSGATMASFGRSRGRARRCAGRLCGHQNQQ